MKVAADPFDVNFTSTPVVQSNASIGILTTIDEKPEIDDAADEEEEEEIVQTPEIDDEGGEDTPPESDELDVDGRTGSSIMAEAYKKQGFLPEDFEITDSLSSAELFNALREHAVNEAREDVEQEYRQRGYDEQLLEYAQFIAQGGNPQAVQQHTIYDQLANYEPQGEEDHKALVRAMLQDKQVDEDSIEDMLETLEVNDKLEAKAEQAKKYFGQKRDVFFQEQQELARQQAEAQQQAIKEQENLFRRMIQKGDLGGIKLSTTEAKELEKAFLERTEVVVQQGPDGKKYKQKITKFEKQMQEIRMDPEKTLQFAYLVLNGPDKVKNKAKSEAREEFLDVLDAKQKLTTVRQPQVPKKNVFQQFASSQPIIMKH